ncbi:MAG TPA: vWA domain-containing protein [Gammaproteobacteria bacterium]|nr:vWA domain-containing protein [Gammaproteobacteria bacterium]
MEEVLPPVSKTAWTELFHSLKLLPDYQDIDITVTDDELVITADTPEKLAAVKQHLQDNLFIPENLLQNVKTKLHDVNADDADMVRARAVYRVQYADQAPPAPKQGDGVGIFERVFGEEFTLSQDMKVKVSWKTLFEERPGMTVLMSKNPVDDLIKGICSRWTNEVTLKASQIPLFNLRRLYMGKPMLGADDAEDLDFHMADLELLQRCFGFVEKDGKTYFYCDYDLLYKTLFAPEIKEVVSQEVSRAAAERSRSSLHIGKKHLIAYMRQIFTEGLVMELLSQEPPVAQPFLLPSPVSQAARSAVILMLDTSGSMERKDGAYEKNVLALVQELAKRCKGENDLLYIVPFSDKPNPEIRKFSFSEIAEISKNPGWLLCKGETKLYGSLQQLLVSPEMKGCDPRQDNLSLILVTDGCDNVQTAENKEKLDKLVKSKAVAVPQFFTVGYGQSYDAALCAQLTTVTGGHHQALTNISELAAIKHIEQIVRPRTLVEFKKVAETIREQFISVYDTPVKLDETIKAGERFCINGREMIFGAREVVVQRLEVEEPVQEEAPQEAAPRRGVFGNFFLPWAQRSGFFNTEFYQRNQRATAKPVLPVGALPQSPPSPRSSRGK